ncbi:DUF5958 family protein [Streptomyces sp. NBC_00322]|uniref:DUF5958 family protein n=1 Tax=Streptomyces sp. NBC_00322 TaxID=2975712 RepID=UPI002E2C6735|nr:DUF5958 family protein [Streptomyces sp. NBC_00322]
MTAILDERCLFRVNALSADCPAFEERLIAACLRPERPGQSRCGRHGCSGHSRRVIQLTSCLISPWARAVVEDGPESIRRAGLLPTHTPAVLITRGRIEHQLGKIVSHPPRRTPQRPRR